MTISSSSRVAGPFNGNGVTTVFPFTFKVFSSADLRIVKTNTGGIESDLVIGSNPTVSLNANQDVNPGGSVTYTTLATGEKLTIIGNTVASQPTDITNGSGFYASVIETAFDRCMMVVQQVLTTLSRAITFPVSDSSSLTKQLPTAALRANKALVFGPDGSVGVSGDNYNDQAAAAAASAAAASASASAAASSESSASASAASAAASFDSFDDRYLGAKASDPTVDNDGNPLLTGALYWNTTISWMKVWTGSVWVNVTNTTIRSGSGAPAGALGADGDFYMDVTSYSFYGPKTAGAWGVPINLKPVDTYLSKSVAGGSNVTLTSGEASNTIINLTGAITANINVIVPNVVQRWTFINSTTGAFTVTVKTAAGTGVVVQQSSNSAVMSDGTNVDLSDKSGVTPAQFESSLRDATTEFVQRALGNDSGIYAIATTQTLTAAHAGGFIGITAAGITLTLPNRSLLTDGVRFKFVNSNGNGTSTVAPPGGDTFVVAFGSTKSNVSLGPGDSVEIVKFGSTWIICGGSQQLGVPSSISFGNSLATNGYRRLPGGDYLQWGRVTTSGSADVAVSFPIAFPNACFSIVFGNVSMNAFGAAGANGQPTASGFNAAGYAGSGRVIINANWWAVGN